MAGKKRAPGCRGDYEVGYCRPPVNTRWQKGRSPNPGGRRKSSASGMKAIPGPRLDNPIEDAVLRVMDEVVECEVSPGHWRRVPQSEALVRELVARAAYDPRSLKQLLEIHSLAHGREMQRRAEEARGVSAPLLKEIVEALYRSAQLKSAEAPPDAGCADVASDAVRLPEEAHNASLEDVPHSQGEPARETSDERFVARPAAARVPCDAPAEVVSDDAGVEAVPAASAGPVRRRHPREPMIPAARPCAGHGYGIAGHASPPPPRFS